MAKRRMVDGKIRSSQTFSRLSWRQKDLWHGLIEVVDDQGRIPGKPSYVRSQVWPFDDVPSAEVDTDLKQLEELGFIFRYEVNGSVFIQLINWHYYQRDAEWLGLSDYPASPGWIDHARYHGKGGKPIALNWANRLDPPILPPTLPCTLPTPLPTALPKSDVNGDGNGNGNGEGDGEQKTLASFDPQPVTAPGISGFPKPIQALWKITGICPPITIWDEIQLNYQTAQDRQHLSDTQYRKYLKEKFDLWCASTTEDGRPYNPSNWKWLEWAITNYVPRAPLKPVDPAAAQRAANIASIYRDL
jgi:hypothetical protein